MTQLADAGRADALVWYQVHDSRFAPWLKKRIATRFSLNDSAMNTPWIDVIAEYQAVHGLQVDGILGTATATHLFGHDIRGLLNPMVGSLRDSSIRTGKSRGRWGLYQRRVRPQVFGEPVYEVELVSATTHPERPHAIVYDAWQRMIQAAERAGIERELLEIHGAYRSVAFQKQIFDYWVEERRKKRLVEGKPELSLEECQRAQMKWTAKPGTSAHHTGFALDLKLYALRNRKARQTEAFRWLVDHARTFGFYPYMPEAWHWEYNPPGLLAQLSELRRRIREGNTLGTFLKSPEQIPVAVPGCGT